MQSRTRVIAIGLVIAVVGAAIGWWSYGAHQKRELRKTIVGLVADSASRMREALATPADSPETARRDEEHTAAVERNLAQLKGLAAAREQSLADAADDYLLTSREILKRVVESRRYRQMLAESLQALTGHMRADNRTGAWVQEAVKARERVNKDHRGYAAAAAALDKLLLSFPDSQKRIAPHVEPAVLIDATVIGTARARVISTASQADADVAKSRQLETFR
jgi:uncharacterized membrane protein YccC